MRKKFQICIYKNVFRKNPYRSSSSSLIYHLPQEHKIIIINSLKITKVIPSHPQNIIYMHVYMISKKMTLNHNHVTDFHVQNMYGCAIS